MLGQALSNPAQASEWDSEEPSRVGVPNLRMFFLTGGSKFVKASLRPFAFHACWKLQR